MHPRIGTAVFAAMLAAAPAVSAYTLGETGAATAIQGTLAGTNSMNVAGTLNSVKNALGNATDQQNAKLKQAQGGNNWGGKSGGQSAWATNGKGTGKGWAQGAGWGASGGKGGAGAWQTASAGASKAWATGSWGKAHN